MADYSRATTIDGLPERYNAAVDLIESNLNAGRADKAAVIDAYDTVSYGGLADRVDRMANVLLASGIGREQRILLCLLDTVDFPTAFLGAIKAGIVPAPLNTLLTTDDYRWILQRSGARAVIVSGALADKWAPVAAENPQVRFISSRGGPWPDLQQLLQQSSAHAVAADTHRDDVAFWLFSSGSTGKPKGVMHTHGSLRLTANLYGLPVAGYRDSDIVLSVAKQFFAYGLGNALTFPYAAGATAVLMEGRATPASISELMMRHKVTVLGGVPTFFAGWLAATDTPTREQVPHFRLATSAGEALPAHLGRAVSERFGVDVLDGLGSTEMLHIFISQQPGSVRYGCTGRVVQGYEARVITGDGQRAAPGEVGELQIKGPTAAVAYWRDRPRSRATFVGEWTRTGDQYTCDADGWYSHVGRDDDMMKVGGIYVSPLEVEEALASHECVLEVGVVAAFDADKLVKPKAYVVLKQGFVANAALEAELKAHVQSQLAPYKYPRWFAFVPELPRTPTGKLQRFKLREGQ